MSELRYDAFLKALKKGQIKACLIQQHEDIVFEYYKNKKAVTALHAINSCSKSITSMLIGICIREGSISDIHEPVKEYFPEYFTNETDKRKSDMTIYHLLTMTSGLNWPEFGEWKYWSPMEFSPNIIMTALERDLETQPGVKMNYNSGTSNLLSAIIKKASGMQTLDFAHRYLFGPLGIEEVIWHEKQGIHLGANGIKMKAADMLRLGSLYLQKGKWQGKQVIPEEWIEESTWPHFITYPDIGHYGYQWWISEFEREKGGQRVPFYFALGLFGQFIIVVPDYDMVAVFTSENYSETMKPLRLFKDNIGRYL